MKTYQLEDGTLMSARFTGDNGAAVLDFLTAFVEEHTPRQTGQCDECGHYGQDCFGSRAANLLADLQEQERPILISS